jgi:hypothetical protein
MTYNQVIKLYGGVSRAARGLGFTRQGVYHWRDHGISYKTQIFIEWSTGGKLKSDRKPK